MGSGQPEAIDIVTATGEFVRRADRREVHDGAHWHEVFHCLVIRSTAPAKVILQRRHRSKAAFPGLLDLSATGHLTAGETPLDGVRELNEELGTEAKADELVPVGVRLLADDGGEGRNRERVHLYFTVDDRPLNGFAPAADEVESLVEVEVSGLLSLLEPLDSATVDATEWTPGSQPEPVAISAADMVKPTDGYWTVALVMAQRFVAGQRPLAI